MLAYSLDRKIPGTRPSGLDPESSRKPAKSVFRTLLETVSAGMTFILFARQVNNQSISN
jgi:hypothetical protein